ncbi:MAG: TRAP transporter large permease [Polaromonas sp.]|nr:TRAP transporter large permease [Polaromonas sp.]
MSYVVLPLFLILLTLGIPIYLALGVTGAAMFGSEGALLSFAQKIIDELNSTTLLAVPYFVIAATFMERGGVAQALIDAAEAWVGRLRGGLGLVSVLSCAIFAAMCGSSVATAIAMGTILVPAMHKAGYSRSFAAGVVGSSGTLGILIPPSLAFVVYGVLADVSIPRLFLAGVVPGLMQAVMLALYILWHSHHKGYATGEVMPRREKYRRSVAAIPALFVPVIVLGGLYGGIVTLTESAALSAVVAMILSLFFYRGMKVRDTLPVLAEAVRNAAAIMIIITMALAFGHWITESGVTTKVVQLVTESDIEAWQFLMVMNIILLILGMFLEVFTVLLLTVPILIPLLQPLGIDPIHFGVVMVINMELALLTPPVGLNLFVIANISKTPLADVIRGTTPFMILMLGLLMLMTYVPSISLWLPKLLMG